MLDLNDLSATYSSQLSEVQAYELTAIVNILVSIIFHVWTHFFHCEKFLLHAIDEPPQNKVSKLEDW